MLNADGAVWVDRLGEGMVRTPVLMAAGDAERMLRLVASEVLVELNPQNPSLSAKLPPPWGARLQGAIPPIVDAPVFALRKPASLVFSLDDYVASGILLPRQRDALAAAVRARDNILIGGGTGSGKTTFANALLRVVAETSDRVHIIEDTPELQCAAANKLQVMVQPGVHSWRDAIMAAMRFRPDRILVGEVRDGSALELLKAWNTGHPGGVATIHANDTRAMLDRLCQLIEEVVFPAPRALVAQTIQVCVHIQRDKTHPAGRRVSGLDRVLRARPGRRLGARTPSPDPPSSERTHAHAHRPCSSRSPAPMRARRARRSARHRRPASRLARPPPNPEARSFGGLGGGMPWEGPLQQLLDSLDRTRVARHRRGRDHRPGRRPRVQRGRLDDAQGPLGRAGTGHRVQRRVLGARVSRLLGRAARMSVQGLEVPLHRSLVEPMLLAGLPRTVALVLWTTVGAFALGLHQIWVLPVGIVVHIAAAAATRADPYVLEIVLALKTQKRLDPEEVAMFSLREYREPSSRLPDRQPWAYLVAPGVVLQKDAIFQKTIAFRGPDLASSLDTELVVAAARINNALRRLGSGWGLFIEAQRFESSGYPEASWSHPAAAVVDGERRRAFEQAGAHFESSYYLTFTWRLPADRHERAAAFFYGKEATKGAGKDEETSRSLARALEHFQKAVAEIVDILSGVFPEVGALDDDQTLSYLHSTISTNRHPVRAPETRTCLDALLPDMPFQPGDVPMLGNHFLCDAAPSRAFRRRRCRGCSMRSTT